MKKYILILTAFFIFQKWDAISAYVNPPPDYSDLHASNVIMYSTEWCGYCKKARVFLRDRGIRYQEYDVEKSSEGREQYTSLGGNGVPLFLVNGAVIRGYNPDRILELLK